MTSPRKGLPLGDVETLAAEVQKWSKVWKHAAQCAAPLEDFPEIPPLPRPTPRMCVERHDPLKSARRWASTTCTPGSGASSLTSLSNSL